jgi:hypothetical protein
VVDDAAGAAAIVDHFFLTSASDGLAAQLHTMHQSIETRLRGYAPAVERVVVRRADIPPRATNKETPRLRLLAEGAVASSACGVVPDTRLAAGQVLGHWHGSDKATVDAAGRKAVIDAGFAGTAADRDRLSLSAAAALAALTAP